jgi:hypothetical protein
MGHGLNGVNTLVLKPGETSVSASDIPVGADLLAKASCQSKIYPLICSLREQARSHSFLRCCGDVTELSEISPKPSIFQPIEKSGMACANVCVLPIPTFSQQNHTDPQNPGLDPKKGL